VSIDSQAAELTAALLAAADLDERASEALRALRDALEPHLGPGRRDPVTGLGSRAQFEARLASGGGRAALCLFELDGPAGSDDAARAAAAALRGVRDRDLAFRVGERAFAVLLPGTPLVGARVVGERIADRIATETSLTASYGAADSAAGDPRGLHAAAASDLAGRRRRRPAGAAAVTV
jgi:GGDEF domain-containing protein